MEAKNPTFNDLDELVAHVTREWDPEDRPVGDAAIHDALQSYAIDAILGEYCDVYIEGGESPGIVIYYEGHAIGLSYPFTLQELFEVGDDLQEQWDEELDEADYDEEDEDESTDDSAPVIEMVSRRKDDPGGA